MMLSRGIAKSLAAMVVMAAGLAGCAPEEEAPSQEQVSQQGYSQQSVPPAGETEAAAPEPQGEASEDTDPRRDPQWVMVQASEALFSWQPVTDVNRGDATVRAAEYLMPELVHSTPSISPGQQWQMWREEGAIITAEARLLDETHPPDTETTRWRVLEVVQSKATGEGIQQVEPTTTVWMACERQKDGTWLVKDYRQM